MPFNISDFKVINEAIGNARYYNYEVYLTLPDALRETAAVYYNPVKDLIRFSVDSVNFPSTGSQVYNVRRYGYGALERKPVFPTFNQIQMTIQLDEQTKYQTFFHDWSRRVTNFDFDTGGSSSPSYYRGAAGTQLYSYEIGYKLDYSVDLMLQIYNSMGEQVKTIFFREAYPVTVADINYAWGHENDYVKLPVMFTFFDWYERYPGESK